MKRYNMENDSGFTLIELMIVIAIIGILAAVAISNYISFRDKGYCTQAESDAVSIANAISDYFAIPSNQSISLVTNATSVAFPPGPPFVLSGQDTVTITAGGNNQYIIAVTDQSGRCPLSYRSVDILWSGGAIGTYTITTF